MSNDPYMAKVLKELQSPEMQAILNHDPMTSVNRKSARAAGKNNRAEQFDDLMEKYQKFLKSRDRYVHEWIEKELKANMNPVVYYVIRKFRQRWMLRVLGWNVPQIENGMDKDDKGHNVPWFIVRLFKYKRQVNAVRVNMFDDEKAPKGKRIIT